MNNLAQRNIKALCPDLNRKIEVLDDWYPSYIERGRKYVLASISACDATQDEITRKYFNSRYTDDNGDSYRYMVIVSVWGQDDTGVVKEYYTNDFTEAIYYYRSFKKLLNKLQKCHPKNLRYYLLDIGFIPA